MFCNRSYFCTSVHSWVLIKTALVLTFRRVQIFISETHFVLFQIFLWKSVKKNYILHHIDSRIDKKDTVKTESLKDFLGDLWRFKFYDISVCTFIDFTSITIKVSFKLEIANLNVLIVIFFIYFFITFYLLFLGGGFSIMKLL